MLGEILDKSIEGVIDWLGQFKRLFLDHDHDGANSKKIGTDADYVDKTTDQTIAGVKTFSSLPQVPTGAPTADAEVISKDYFDTKAAKLDTAQNFTAIQTFSIIPHIPTTDPDEDADIVSKKFLTDNYTKDDETDVSAKSWVVDEDNMGSDLNTKVPTQQSVKAYADSIAGSKVIEVNATAVNISNTTDETTLLTATIPGGTLGTGNVIRTKIFFDTFKVSATADVNIYVKYGSTTVITESESCSFGSNMGGAMEILLAANGATNSQYGCLSFHAASDGYTSVLTDFFGLGTASEDSTGDLTFAVTFKFSLANASNTFSKRLGIIEKIT